MEIIVIFAVFMILSFICGISFARTFSRSKVKSYTVSNEQLTALVKQYYSDTDYTKVDFTQFVTDWLAGKVPPQPMSSSGKAKVVEPCLGPDCSCYPTREDHCICMTKDGQCRHAINLNVICGIHDCAEEVARRADLLTSEEVSLLTEALLNRV